MNQSNLSPTASLKFIKAGFETPSSCPSNDETFVESYDNGNGKDLQTPSSSSLMDEKVQTIDRFNRTNIDRAFGAGTSGKGFTKHGKKTREIVNTSPAVEAGLVKVRKDQNIDQRSKAVKQGLVVVDDDGGVVKGESLLCQKQIVFKQNGDVSKSSAAVKNGLILLKDDGKVNKDSYALRNGWLKLNEDESVNSKESALCQTLYLKETNGSHIHGFEVADMITKSELLYNTFLLKESCIIVVYFVLQVLVWSTTRKWCFVWCMPLMITETYALRLVVGI